MKDLLKHFAPGFCFILALSSWALPAGAAPVPLASLQPATVYAYNPALSAAPAPVSIAVNEGPPQPGLRFAAESEVTYAVPAEQNSFSGVIVFELRSLDVPQDEFRAYTKEVLRIAVDGKTEFERGVDSPQPPLEFSVPVRAGQKLTIISRSDAAGAAFSLVAAQFSPERRAAGSTYLPASGQGYVDFTPAPRQGVIGAFFPGESVPVTAVFAGQATEATVSFQLTPEGGTATPVQDRAQVSLSRGAGGIAQGGALWQVPAHQGPAALSVDEQVGGQTVFHREMRVAVIPHVELARVSSSTFAVHVSGSGHLIALDEFAYLWGAKWGRVFVRWPILEPSSGQFDFSRIDALVDTYRAQNMNVLVALGEDTPAWAGSPGSPDYMAAWERYLTNVVKHFAGKVQYWDVFNEVDVKYASPKLKGEPDWDIKVLRAALQTIHRADPAARTVCCSTGTSDWLPYDKRLFAGGLLNDIDVISLHPYRPTAPEGKEGPFTFTEELRAPLDLAKSYGASKPEWATEANWIIAPAGTHVRAAGLPESEQAKYVVRANLLAYIENIPYFLHAPFEHTHRPRIHSATLAAYAAMSSFFSGSSGPTVLAGENGLWAVASRNGGAYVGVLWSITPGVQVRLGADNLRFFDFFGNPVKLNPDALDVSDTPTYFRSSTAPQVQVLSQGRSVQWKSVESPARWTCSPNTSCSRTGSGVRVRSQFTKYAYQITSPPISVRSGGCFMARISLNLVEGNVGFFIMDGSTRQRVGSPVRTTFVPDGKFHELQVRVNTGSTRSVNLIVTASNPQGGTSVFEAADPAIADCE